MRSTLIEVAADEFGVDGDIGARCVRWLLLMFSSHALHDQ